MVTNPENTSIIKHTLNKYPNLTIMTTDEVTILYKDNQNVFSSGIGNSNLQNVIEDDLYIVMLLSEISIQTMDAREIKLKRFDKTIDSIVLY